MEKPCSSMFKYVQVLSHCSACQTFSHVAGSFVTNKNSQLGAEASGEILLTLFAGSGTIFGSGLGKAKYIN